MVVKFRIPVAGGQAQALKIISNSGGRMNELIARMAIEQFRSPPVPAEIVARLPDGYFYFEESFTVFEERQNNRNISPAR